MSRVCLYRLLILFSAVSFALLPAIGRADVVGNLKQKLEYAKKTIEEHGLSKIEIVTLDWDVRYARDMGPLDVYVTTPTYKTKFKKKEDQRWLNLLSSYVPQEPAGNYLPDCRVGYVVYSNNERVLYVFLGRWPSNMLLNGHLVKQDDGWMKIILPHLKGSYARQVEKALKKWQKKG